MGGIWNDQRACEKDSSRCKSYETDRQCVVRLRPAMLDARIGKSYRYWQHNCIVALDGNTWASSSKPTLIHEKLWLRVGGFDAASCSRVSYYEWFEPMLKAGVHYIQTTIDGLEGTLEDIEAMDEDKLLQIAQRGHRAFMAIANETSLACYAKLELQRVQRDGQMSS